MSRIRSEQMLLPSILDRLIDLEPDSKTENTSGGNRQSLVELKASVCRDLEMLLNTRVCFTSVPPDQRHLARSVVNYGIPDFGAASVDASRSLEDVRDQITKAIRNFETRFKKFTVELDTKSISKFNRSIHFVIDGVLYADPDPVPVVFSSQLNTLAGEFSVKDRNR